MSERLLLGPQCSCYTDPRRDQWATLLRQCRQERQRRGGSSISLLSLNLLALYLTHCTHTSTMANSTRENKSLHTLSCTAGVCGSLGGRHDISSQFCCSEKAKNSWDLLSCYFNRCFAYFLLFNIHKSVP